MADEGVILFQKGFVQQTFQKCYPFWLTPAYIIPGETSVSTSANDFSKSVCKHTDLVSTKSNFNWPCSYCYVSPPTLTVKLQEWLQAFFRKRIKKNLGGQILISETEGKCLVKTASRNLIPPHKFHSSTWIILLVEHPFTTSSSWAEDQGHFKLSEQDLCGEEYMAFL